MADARVPLRPETRAAFMKALEGLRAAGATVIFDDSILPDSFAVTVARVGTLPYIREGTEKFLAEFGPAQYHSADEYQKAVGSPLPATIIGGMDETSPKGSAAVDPSRVRERSRKPMPTFLPRGKRHSTPTTKYWIGCTLTDSSTRRHKCLRPMRPCRRTGR